ncbi:DDE-type integrase/transposase/recombinase [Pseudonocardia xinjiangensis]|uniref:DDE-type integrase/transposase/recombinase n=1 Tax=Pseudonocardia xinjiangensis TaxID=75289 RepID=UPI003D8D1FA3
MRCRLRTWSTATSPPQRPTGCGPCAQGVFWLAAVRDAFSNRIVGWWCSDRCDTDLILGALEYAVWTRDVRDGEIIHHSDRGSNYTSLRFSHRLDDTRDSHVHGVGRRFLR